MSASPQNRSEFLGTTSIKPLLIRLAWPAMVSTVINMLYNTVDRIYIGNGIGSDALAGLALTMPFMILLAAFGMLGGVGTGAVISIFLGEQKIRSAEKALGQLIVLCLGSIITLQAIALYFLDDAVQLFGGNAATIPYAEQYLRIILWGSIFQHFSFSVGAQMRAEGNSRKCMYAILIGAISNIILDPIFIFVLKMGIAGAATATIISMFISSIYVLMHFILGLGTIRLRLKNLVPDFRLMGRIVTIGLAPACIQVAAAVISIFANRCFNTYAASIAEANHSIACWNIAYTVIFIFITPIFGLTHGMQPVVGYNYGAAQWQRVRSAFVTCLRWGVAIEIIAMAIVFVFSRQLVMCFNREPAIVDLGSHALKIMSTSMAFVPIDIVTIHYFQSIGKASVSIFLSMLRQVIFFLPALLLLASRAGVRSVWWAGPISDGAALCCASIIAFVTIKKLEKLALKSALPAN